MVVINGDLCAEIWDSRKHKRHNLDVMERKRGAELFLEKKSDNVLRKILKGLG